MMLRSRRIQFSQSPVPSAATVRNRLLHDRTMRHHEPDPPTTCRTPAEQHRQILQVARSFKFHYLAQIDYHDDRQLTIALVKPADLRRAAHEIWVDAAGNVSVHHRNMPTTLVRPLRPVSIALSIALVCLFLIILI
jgi:hypothetical protein